MATVRAGSLNKRITLQRRTHARSTYGGVDDTWEDADTVWAAMSPASGREFVGADQQQSTGLTRITMRYRTDVTAAYRIKHGNVYYAIVSPPINPEMANRQLELICEQRSWDN